MLPDARHTLGSHRVYIRGIFLIIPFKPNDSNRGRTAPLTSKRCILYNYSTNIGPEYFKLGLYSPFFLSSKCSLFHNSDVFGFSIIHILYTGCAKIKKIPAPKVKKTVLQKSEKFNRYFTSTPIRIYNNILLNSS